MGARRSHADDAEQRRRVLTRKVPAISRSIAQAFVLKDENVFLVTDEHGSIPLEGPHGFGLYYHDCRFLSGYALDLDGEVPITLAASPAAGSKGVVELTNPVLVGPTGGKLDQHDVTLRWDRLLHGDRTALHDEIRVKSFAMNAADLTVTLSFQAGFEDLYTVRGLVDERPGRLHPARWTDASLCFCYDGKDGIRRSTLVHFQRAPDEKQGACARFRIHLEPGAEETIALSILLSESTERDAPPASPPEEPPDLAHIAHTQRDARQKRAAGMTDVQTDHAVLERTLERSFLDLAMLRSELAGDAYYAAGVPWFVALFGRDALIVALESLAYDPDIAQDTLRLLAQYQARESDPSRDEEPGKILHELRVGELAHIHAIPHTPYYGTVDATPLFLVLVALHASWTGTLDLFRELGPNVDAALAWIAKYGESKQSGFVEYKSKATQGLANQGWKDSGDAIVMKDGSLARQPIALCEVQGYVYLAKTSIARLFERAGDAGRAAKLRAEAEALKQRFARDFWLEDEGICAMALTAGGPAAVLSSNPGQALWTGIMAPDHARRTAESLLSPPMWSGWGIRTLSADAKRYHPIAYHRGTVWPHDNAIIAAGFRRYGFDGAACQVFSGILDASRYFAMHRLPEVFSGLRRADYGVPVHYPVACHPQAWAAGSIPFMLTSLLGLEPDAFEGRLRIVRPTLPEPIGNVALRGLRVGAGSADLAFERRPDGSADVQVLRREGLEVQIEAREQAEEVAAKEGRR